MGTGKTYSTKYLLDSNNNSGVAGQVLVTTAEGVNWQDAESTGDNQTQGSLFDSKIVLIDTPNGGLKPYRVITDEYGEWIQVGRFAASAMTTIQSVWSSVSPLSTGTAQNETTQFSADFGDCFPDEVRIMGATDFDNWRNTRTIDWVYKVPPGRKWKFFFSNGETTGMGVVDAVKYGWTVNGAYDGFGRWTNQNLVSIRMSDTTSPIINTAAAYTTPTTNAFNWETNQDAKFSVSATRTFCGQDTFVTSGVGNDDNIQGFFDEYPSETNNMGGGVDFSSAVWVLIKVPGGASGGGGDDAYWSANGNDIHNDNTGNVGIGITNPLSKLHVANGNIRVQGPSNVSEIKLQTDGTESYNPFGIIRALRDTNTGAADFGSSELNFLTNVSSATTPTVKMVIDSDGNVGIGNTNPQQKLHIVDTDGANIILNSNTGAENNGVWMTEGAAASPYTNGAYVHYDSTNNAFKINTGTTSLSTKLTILRDNGNVGIGVTGPGALLQVGDAPTSSSQQGARIYGYDGALSLYTTRSESNFNTALYLYNDPTGSAVGTGTGIMFRANSDTTSGQQQATAYSSWTTNTHASRTAKLVFQTCNAGTVSDKMTILGNGNVGIGVTDPGEKLVVAGNVFISGGGYLTWDGKGSYVTTVPGNAAGYIFSSSRNPNDGSGVFPFNEYGEMIFQGNPRSGYNGGFTWVTGQAAFGATVAPTPKMTLTTAGNFGIGTISPQQKLDTPNIIISGSSIAASYRANATLMDNLGGVARFYSLGADTSTGGSYQFNSLSSNASAGSGTVMTILSNGNVGIGDTNPTSLSANTRSLTVNSTRADLSGGYITKANGTVTHQMYWDSAGFRFDLSPSSGNFNFKIGNTDKVRISKEGNISTPKQELTSTALHTNKGLYTTEIRLIDTPNGGLKQCRVITDNYGEWILVGRFAADARAKIQGVWSSESGLDTSTAQDNVTRFSADFGDSLPSEVRIMGSTDFDRWRDNRTIDFIYGVPEGRKWKNFFSGGADNGMALNVKYGWGINGAYDGFGRWVNPAQNFVRMSDANVTNPSAAYTTATTNAFNWNVASDAKMSVSSFRVFSGQDTLVTSGFGADDNVQGFFDDYPGESGNMSGGSDFSSAVWVLIKLPKGISSGGGDTDYWVADGNNIHNNNTGIVNIKGPSATAADGNQTLSIQNTTGNTIMNLGTAENSYGWIEAREGVTLRNLLLNPNGGNVGIGVTGPTSKLTIETSAGDGTIELLAVNAATTKNKIIFSEAILGDESFFIEHDGAGAGADNLLKIYGDGSGGTASGITIRRDGRVGINNTSPRNKLTVFTDGSSEEEIALRLVNPIGFNNAGSGASIIFAQDRNVGENLPMAKIRSAQSIGGTSSYGDLIFSTLSTGSPTMQDRMTILSGGNVGIGNNNSTPLYPLDVHDAITSGVIIRAKGIGAMVLIESNTAGEAYLYQKPNTTSDKEARFMMTAGTAYGWAWSDDGSGTPASRVKYMKLDQNPGTLTVKGDVIAYGTPSDISLKENIKPIDSALDKVMKLQGVTFDWKKTDSILELKEDIGFIAQDVQKVVPELIRENSNGLLSMRHQGVAPILLEAIKELKAEIDLLKSKPCTCNKCNCNI